MTEFVFLPCVDRTVSDSKLKGSQSGRDKQFQVAFMPLQTVELGTFQRMIFNK